MTNVPNSAFPVIGEIRDLARAIVNDSFPGINQIPGEGRILTNDASFTIPYLNSALRTMTRALRNEGVTWPIKDYFTILDLPPVVQADPSVFCYVGFDGYFNGTQMYGNLRLPSDCLQIKTLRQRQTGSNLQFTPMQECQEGLPSGYQNQWLGEWEWRQYRIYFNGSLQPQDIMFRYLSGQPPIPKTLDPNDFDITPIHILDCQDAMANLVAKKYGAARGANDAQIKIVDDDYNAAIDEMAREYVRRQQNVTYRRESYQGGGSRSTTDNAALGSTGVI